jgi:inorganic pyrophosphatase
MPRRALPLAFVAACLATACASGGGTPVADGLSADGPHRYSSKRNLLTNWLPRNQDGTVNVVIEIPAGTSEKWEVDDDGSALVRDFDGEKPRVIDYLPYPGNYGLIPRTLLDEDSGGDGGAVDVLVIGPAVPRGTLVRARPIGIIRVVDQLEQDDKILAVDVRGETLRDVYDLETLDARYPGAISILTTWWAHAHGRQSQVSLLGTGSRGQANAVIDYAAEAWKEVDRESKGELGEVRD